LTHVIYKFQIYPSISYNSIDLSEDGFIISVQEQNGIPCVWVVTNTAIAQERHIVDVFGTGNSVDPDRHHFIGTAICGVDVWHLAIRIPED